jgi:hypothetical protein
MLCSLVEVSFWMSALFDSSCLHEPCLMLGVVLLFDSFFDRKVRSNIFIQNFYQATWHHLLDDIAFHNLYHENLKFAINTVICYV